jgi:hypothetical protein
MKKNETKIATYNNNGMIYKVFKTCIDKKPGLKDWNIYYYICYDNRHPQPIFDSNNFDDYCDIKDALKENGVKVRQIDFE